MLHIELQFLMIYVYFLYFPTPKHDLRPNLSCLTRNSRTQKTSTTVHNITSHVLPKTCLDQPEDCLMTSWWQPDDCQITAWRLVTTQQLLNDCQTTVQSLSDDLQITAWQIHLNGTYSTPEVDQWIKWELMALTIFTKFLNIWNPLSENTLGLKDPSFLELSKTHKVHYLILYNKFIINNPWTKSKYIMQKDSTFYRFILFNTISII